MKYKKEGRPKISHFFGLQRELIRLGEKRRGENKKKKKKKKRPRKGMELSKDFYDFWYGSLVFVWN